MVCTHKKSRYGVDAIISDIVGNLSNLGFYVVSSCQNVNNEFAFMNFSFPVNGCSIQIDDKDSVTFILPKHANLNSIVRAFRKLRIPIVETSSHSFKVWFPGCTIIFNGKLINVTWDI